MNGALLLLPLDDRPVNLDFPCLLARGVGEALETPPRALLGQFLTPGQPEALAEWLLRAAPTARAVILALDMLAYGGLVASRTPEIAVEDALRRLALLREVKARHPHLQVLAFSVIMRLTITGADAETRAAGRDIFRYSVLRDECERLGLPGAASALHEVEVRIPPPLLQAYLRARARNHAVNRAALTLLGDGALDFLALVQEDTAPSGLHVAEQQALTALAHTCAPAERWRLYAGTDEAAHTLLARFLLQEAGQLFPVRLAYRDAVAAQHPARYEDVPLRETVRRHLDAVGGTPFEPRGIHGLEAPCHELTLAVQTFTPPQPDLFDAPALLAPSWSQALATFPAPAERWPSLADAGALAVADVAFCNGGDPQLLHTLLADGRYSRLYSYAGWNTAGNTLGTTLAHAALRTLALARGCTPAMDAAHQTALWVRLLDDVLYQSVVRGWIAQRVEENGGSPLNLGTMSPRVEEEVDTAMHQLWQELCTCYPAAALLDRPFRATLPWGRLFEIAIIPSL